MKKCLVALLFLTLFFFLPSSFADTTVLWDWGFSVNGSYTLWGQPIPSYVNAPPGYFDPTSTGFGHFTLTFNTPGHYDVLVYLDIDPIAIEPNQVPINDDQGVNIGIAPGFLAWEIGEIGDVYNDFYYVGALQNMNLIPGKHKDVAVDFGTSFDLVSGSAFFDIFVSPDPPAGGFYLQQITPHGPDIYYSADFHTSETQIPEPATLVLLGSGLFGLAAKYRRRF